MQSQPHPVKKYYFALLLLTSLLLGAFTFMLYQQSKANIDSRYDIMNTNNVLRLGHLVLFDALDLTRVKDLYLNNGSSRYLESYKTTLATLNTHLEEFGKAKASNEAQHENIAYLRGKVEALKLSVAEQIDALHKKSAGVSPLKPSLANIDKATADVIEGFAKFREYETTLVDQQAKIADRQHKHSVNMLLGGAAADLAALLIANLVVFLLIAKNKRAHDKLKKSEEIFAQILSGVNDGVFDYNLLTGRIDYSLSYKEMLGYSTKELGMTHDRFLTLVHPDDLASSQDVMRQYIEGETSAYSNVFRVRHKTGQWVWILSRGVGIRDRTGKMTRLIGTHTDISEQKQREEEVIYFAKENERQRSELALAKEKAEDANRAKTDFLSTMSHEIRTPMNVVIGAAHILTASPLDPKLREVVDILKGNADILLRLVNDLLDLGRIESGQLKLETNTFTFDGVFNAIRSMFKQAADAKGLRLILNDHTDGTAYLGDVLRIQQILLNLVGNALKFTTSGSITIQADPSHPGDNANFVTLSVTDTGVGISEDKLQLIFDRFTQADQTIWRRFGGSGLGLAICQSLAGLMNGNIRVESELGEGSTFTVTLPLPLAHADQTRHSNGSALISARPATSEPILIVEDYTPNLRVVSLLLENMGYGFETARSGTEAIEKIRERENPFSAIMMDVQMQDMNGFEATQNIRLLEKEKGFRHYIIGVTAHALVGDRDHCLSSGMDDYLSKPIHPDLLAEKLRRGTRMAA